MTLSQHDAAANKGARRKRFSPGKPRATLEMTDRDRVILEALWRHRFLRSDQLVRIAGGSPQGVLRRLRDLFDARFVDRPRAQLASLVLGNRPMVYALGDAGHDWLHQHFDHVESGSGRSREKNNSATNFFIEHATATAEFFIGLEASAAYRKGCELVHAEALNPDDPFIGFARWEVGFHGRTGEWIETALQPDGLVGLRQDDKLTNFMIEIDRGTEPIRRSDVRGSSIEKKMRGYAKLHVDKLTGLENFRVLFVTTSEARIASMIEAIPSCAPKGLFLFASLSKAARDPFDLVWTDGHGVVRSLMSDAADRAD